MKSESESNMNSLFSKLVTENTVTEVKLILSQVPPFVVSVENLCRQG